MGEHNPIPSPVEDVSARVSIPHPSLPIDECPEPAIAPALYELQQSNNGASILNGILISKTILNRKVTLYEVILLSSHEGGVLNRYLRYICFLPDAIPDDITHGTHLFGYPCDCSCDRESILLVGMCF